ncbi:MAG: hypothetical protein ACHQYP_07370 [Nitrospiria bacterium]
MLKFVEAEDGYLTIKDILFIYTMLAQKIKWAHDHNAPEKAEYEMELWLKLQPAVLQLNGFNVSTPDPESN